MIDQYFLDNLTDQVVPGIGRHFFTRYVIDDLSERVSLYKNNHGFQIKALIQSAFFLQRLKNIFELLVEASLLFCQKFGEPLVFLRVGDQADS